MIVAKNADAANYKGFSPLLDKALDLLTPEFLASVGTETVHVDGEKLYATRNIFETAPDSETFFESRSGCRLGFVCKCRSSAGEQSDRRDDEQAEECEQVDREG